LTYEMMTGLPPFYEEGTLFFLPFSLRKQAALTTPSFTVFTM
jgi:hypothetical protein